MKTIGVISDTHRQLPDKVIEIFSGRAERLNIVESLVSAASPTALTKPVDLIVHAGDIGELEPLSQNVIDKLEEIAPVRAVLGNRDAAGYTAGGMAVDEQLLELEVDGVTLAVMHRPEDLFAAVKDLPRVPGVLIHGHTHVPRLERSGPSIRLCPGSIHKPRGDWPMRTVALVRVEAGAVASAELVKV